MKRRVIVAVGFTLLVAACGGTETATTATISETSTTSGEPVSTIQADEPQTDQSQADGLAAQAGDLVSVHYIGTLNDGTVFDESRPRGSTLDFTVGGGQMIAGFDAGVVGMEVGVTRTVVIAPEDAYGLKSDAAIIEISRDQADGEFEIGDQVVLGNGQSGVVVALTDTAITVDANPRLAGETLTFEIEMMAIDRPAS